MARRTNLKYVRNWELQIAGTCSTQTPYTFTEPMTLDRIVISGVIVVEKFGAGTNGACVMGLFYRRDGQSSSTPTTTNGLPPYAPEEDILWSTNVTQGAVSAYTVPLRYEPYIPNLAALAAGMLEP